MVVRGVENISLSAFKNKDVQPLLQCQFPVCLQSDHLVIVTSC